MTSGPIPITLLNVAQGSRFTESVNCVGDDGEAVPFVSDGDWAGRAQVRSSYDGSLVMTFASTGSADGTVTFDDIGNVHLSLTSTFTATLTPTSSVRNLQADAHIGDLELWNTGTPTDRVRVTDLKVRIYPEATTS